MILKAPTELEILGAVGNIATIILALVAIVVGIVTSVAIHRATGPVVKVRVLAYAILQQKVKDSSIDRYRHVTTSISSSEEIYEKFEEDYFITLFLRAIVTNRGRMDVSVDSIAYQNRELNSRATRQRGDPEYPVLLKAQSYLYYNALFGELVSWAGRYSQIRFVVSLTTGDVVYSKWIRVYPRPAST